MLGVQPGAMATVGSPVASVVSRRACVCIEFVAKVGGNLYLQGVT